MGERKGQNKYYPPDFDPAKHFSLDKYHGTHPLRERARKLHQGILIIRFEMPYNIWCDGCQAHIGMGVRYNAEKSKVGNYYTTPIYQFRMKCHLCDNYFEIKTDPQNHDYVIISGARRKEQRWDPAENEQIVTEDKNDVKKRATDAMFKLEHGVDDKEKTKMSKPALGKLQNVQKRGRDDYLLNKLARHKFRNEKKSLKIDADKDKALLERSSLEIPLAAEDDQDVRLASLLKYSSTESYEEKQKQKREEIETRPLFSPSASSPMNIVEVKKKLNLSINSKLPNPFGVSTSKQAKDSVNFGIVRRKSRNCDNQQKETDIKKADNATEKMAEDSSKDVTSPGQSHDQHEHNSDKRTVSSGALNSLVSVYGESDSNSDSNG